MKAFRRLINLAFLPLVLTGCTADGNIKENHFFLTMYNIQLYPEEYIKKQITLDCFTYDIEDINGIVTTVGVRKCPSAYGCKCGKDSVIGFILNYDGEIPPATNQAEDSVEKTWIHISGKLASQEKTTIELPSTDVDGNPITDSIQFLTLNVETLELIEDYQNLNWYVTK